MQKQMRVIHLEEADSVYISKNSSSSKKLESSGGLETLSKAPTIG